MAQGFGVLVRADFWNRLYFVTLAQLTHALSEPSWLDLFHTFGTLIASLPLLWLVHRQLLAFTPGGFFKTFGLSPKRAQLGSILCVATAALAIDLFCADEEPRAHDALCQELALNAFANADLELAWVQSEAR